MFTIRSKSIVVISMLGLVANAAMAKDEKAEKPEKTPAVDPKATGALEKMGGFLRDQESFSVRTTSETEHVLASGQKVRVLATGTIRVQRPDHLRADVTSDIKERQLFYDGKRFTINSPQVGYYATVAAPGTIKELADTLESRYDLQLPLVDLFRWGADPSSFDELTSAVYVGPSKIDNVVTDQYAFRQVGLDWNIWIERGDKPVPRKLVLTTTDDAAMPVHEVNITWDLDAKFDDAVFAFAPAKDSKQIKFAEAPQMGAMAKQPKSTKTN